MLLVEKKGLVKDFFFFFFFLQINFLSDYKWHVFIVELLENIEKSQMKIKITLVFVRIGCDCK